MKPNQGMRSAARTLDEFLVGKAIHGWEYSSVKRVAIAREIIHQVEGMPIGARVWAVYSRPEVFVSDDQAAIVQWAAARIGGARAICVSDALRPRRLGLSRHAVERAPVGRRVAL